MLFRSGKVIQSYFHPLFYADNKTSLISAEEKKNMILITNPIKKTFLLLATNYTKNQPGSFQSWEFSSELITDKDPYMYKEYLLK